MQFKTAGISGTRRPEIQLQKMAKKTALRLKKLEIALMVGDAPGIDQICATAYGNAANVFKAASTQKWALAMRSAQMVLTLAASERPVLFAFPATPPTYGLVPHRRVDRCFAGFGSGTWATVALAIGNGVPVFLYGPPPPENWGNLTKFERGWFLITPKL